MAIRISINQLIFATTIGTGTVVACQTSSSAIAERLCDARVTSIRKIGSGIFEPPFWGLRGNVDASCVHCWKKRGQLPIGDN